MNIWSIAPQNDFLAVLAEAVAEGRLLDMGSAKAPPLSDWTILVPTRRAARALAQIFIARSGARAMLLPRIRPIGDIDEESLADSVDIDGVPPALPALTLTHLLIDLLRQWALRNRNSEIAANVLSSPTQALNLALSLQALVNQFHTEEVGFAALPDAYDLDLAGHRAAILDLLQVIASDLPKRLLDLGHCTAAQRRNRLLRLEAERITAGALRRPLLAAGSTGSNPATRALLRAIALKTNGCVVLPGVDTALDDGSWEAITPDHPQAALKALLAYLEVSKEQVKQLGSSPGPRQALIRDAMRPARVSDQWQAQGNVGDAMAGLVLSEAQDRHEEAMSIALRLKQHLVEGSGNGALITPDRDLARRVAAVLSQWDINIDDSNGIELARTPPGSLLHLLIRATQSGFAPEAFLALLHHPRLNLGLEENRAARLKELLDITCFRGLPQSCGLDGLSRRVVAAQDRASDAHAHPLLRKVEPGEWLALHEFAAQLVAILARVTEDVRPFATHVRGLSDVLRALAPDCMEEDALAGELSLLLEALSEDVGWQAAVSFSEIAPVLLHHLSTTVVRPPLPTDARISILGLLEARTVPLQLAILGGLNEGAWPQVADTGPWLNRRMREHMGLSLPERDTGMTAHDFVQGMGRPEVMVIWSKRLEGKPALPSRWVLRLRAVLDVWGLPQDQQLSPDYTSLARRTGKPSLLAPWPRPKARPPVAARPLRFSVTRIETLVRDSYAIYAREILRLEPLDDVAEEPDHSLRGMLIHAALRNWLSEPYEADDLRNEARLLDHGRRVFAPYMQTPEVAQLWWPRFRRMARELKDIERHLRSNISGTAAEIQGRMQIEAGGVPHDLTARADRIDRLHDGSLRIIDYKSGTIPTLEQVKSGFAPQLTLEKLIAETGEFTGMARAPVSEAAYVDVGGKKAAAALRYLDDKDFVLDEVARLHHAELIALLARYQDATQAYVPRHNMQQEQDHSDFDHLSRRFEWQLAGDGS